MKKAERRVAKLANDALILCASLVLSEPTVNRKQITLAGQIIKQAKPFAALRATRTKR